MRRVLGSRRPSGAVLLGAGGGVLVLVLAIVVAFSLFADEPPSDDPAGEHGAAEVIPPLEEETIPASELVPAERFATGPRAHRSKAEAKLVDVGLGKGKGVETVTFTFDGGDALPQYQMVYRDAVRLHPHDDPIPVEGEAFLIVSYELTDPNQAGRLAFSPRIHAGPEHRQIAEVLLFDNLAGSLRFAIGVHEKAPFRLQTLQDPSRLVVEIKTP